MLRHSITVCCTAMRVAQKQCQPITTAICQYFSKTGQKNDTIDDQRYFKIWCPKCFWPPKARNLSFPVKFSNTSLQRTSRLSFGFCMTARSHCQAFTGWWQTHAISTCFQQHKRPSNIALAHTVQNMLAGHDCRRNSSMSKRRVCAWFPWLCAVCKTHVQNYVFQQAQSNVTDVLPSIVRWHAYQQPFWLDVSPKKWGNLGPWHDALPSYPIRHLICCPTCMSQFWATNCMQEYCALWVYTCHHANQWYWLSMIGSVRT